MVNNDQDLNQRLETVEKRLDKLEKRGKEELLRIECCLDSIQQLRREASEIVQYIQHSFPSVAYDTKPKAN